MVRTYTLRSSGRQNRSNVNINNNNEGDDDDDEDRTPTPKARKPSVKRASQEKKPATDRASQEPKTKRASQESRRSREKSEEPTPEREVAPVKVERRRSRKKSLDNSFDEVQEELNKAMERKRKCQEEKAKLNLKDIRDLQKQFKQTCDKSKRDTQQINERTAIKKTAGRTRSGVKRGVTQQPFYSVGKWIDKGITEAREKFADDEKEYLKNAIDKVKEVKELKFDHLKYLILDVFLDDLKSIKTGGKLSNFHSRYSQLEGKSKSVLLADIRLSLFTNEQRDYINGLLQGAFETDMKDDDGKIKHKDIEYVSIVMLAEATIRVVKYVHKLENMDEAFQFTIQKSREALGLEDD